MPYELVIVGAGISGLAAAVECKKMGVERVLLLDYEKQKGGFLSPLFGEEAFQVEKRLLEESEPLPYPIWQQSTLVGLFLGEEGSPHELTVQTSTGTEFIQASKLMLCSGSFEKPREAHQIAGPRPAGIMISSMALNLLARGYRPGNKIVVMENGRTSKCTADIFEQKGFQVERKQGNEWEVAYVKGHSRLQSVELQHRETQERVSMECDTLIFGQGRIPCTFYLKGTSFERDAHHAIVVDEAGRTNIPGVSAAGTCTQRGEDHHLHSISQAQEAIRKLFMA